MSGPAFGQASSQADASDYNTTDFIARAVIAGMQTVSIVKVIAVHGGGVAPTGTVDVQVLVNLMTGAGTAVPHDVIYDVPFTRTQGGISAVICDPIAGDIGMAAFASRDITSVKNARGQANPSSKRMFDWADAIYSSGMLNGTPTQYVLFGMSGIEIVSPTALTITAPTVTVNASTSATITSPVVAINASTSATITSPEIALNGNVTIAGTLSQTGGGAATLSGALDVTGVITGAEVKAGAIPLSTHQHLVVGVQPGSSDILSDPP